MKWKSLIVLLIVILVASGCAEKSQESNNNTLIESSDSGMQETREISSSAEGVPIDSIVFSRAGALLTLQSATELSEIRVYSGEEQIASQKVGETEGNIFASFDWNPKSQYRFEVITGSGESSTIEAYAPSKPALKEEYTIELEDVTPGNIEKTNANIRGVTKFSPNSK